ncbi:MAG TPA: hypothetical protein VN903_03825 [Polyangia bacterium]|nr:hypothetical protein [Polyangia bacterium]
MLHALIAALILRAGGRAARRALNAPPETIEFDLDIDVDRPDIAPDPSPLPSPREAGRGDKKEVGRGEKKAAPVAHAPVASSPLSPPPSSPSSSSPSSPSARPSVGDKIDLSFGALPDDVKGRFRGAPPPEETLRERPGRFDVDKLRAALDRDRDAVNNVESGRVDPLLYEYLRGARSRFSDTAKKLAEQIELGPGETMHAWGRGYMQSVQERNSGALGARADTPREGGGDTRNEISPAADVLGQYREAGRQAEVGAEERRAEVCVDVAAGRETKVALRRGSGNAALDKVAVDSFARAVAVRPVPPDARRGLACYELRISAFRMPPLPFVACSFDIGITGPTCVWPYKKVTSVKGKLLSVEYPPAEGARAGSPLIRKPR